MFHKERNLPFVDSKWDDWSLFRYWCDLIFYYKHLNLSRLKKELKFIEDYYEASAAFAVAIAFAVEHSGKVCSCLF